VAGLPATLAAVERGLTVGLANKESLVVAGKLLVESALRSGSRLLPIDSEHSAIFQSLQSGAHEEVERLFLTASGGPFRTWTLDQMRTATAADALRHPTWDMGPKITIDSATMMNKALEVIEARWLFDIDADQIEVVIHPESIIHSA
jgi:1-deoxy-D-xylulose-5-phosphate reductoisomerase